MNTDSIPFCVEPGFTSEFIPNVMGETYRILFYKDGRVAFEHKCDRGERGVIICAPFLRMDGGHRIESRDPLTITPSILCSDCGTHGFVRNGRWVQS